MLTYVANVTLNENGHVNFDNIQTFLARNQMAIERDILEFFQQHFRTEFPNITALTDYLHQHKQQYGYAPMFSIKTF